MRKAIAIDFDGCICTNAFPSIGKPNWPVIARARAEQRAGAGLILWTCREGQLLQDAVAACENWGLIFDTVNESLPDWIEAFGTRPRKVGAAVNPTTLNGTYASAEWFNRINAELQACTDFTDYEHTRPEASQAGTALRAVINRMAKESIVPMQKLGISLDDGEGGIKSFKQVMDDLYLWKEGNGGLIP